MDPILLCINKLWNEEDYNEKRCYGSDVAVFNLLLADHKNIYTYSFNACYLTQSGIYSSMKKKFSEFILEKKKVK